MRLGQMFLQSLGIDKRISPTDIYDIIEALLHHSDVEAVIKTLNSIYDKEFKGNKEVIKQLSSDISVVKLMRTPVSAKLYLKLLPSIASGATSTVLSKDEIESECMGKQYKHKVHYYRAFGTMLEELNKALQGCIILHKTYNNKAEFYIVRGDTVNELLKNLGEVNLQSPDNIDKIQSWGIRKRLSNE